MKIQRLALIIALVSASGIASALTFQTTSASIRPDASGHLFSNGEVAEYIQVNAAGNYRVSVVALGQPMGGVWPQMALSVDGFAVTERAVNSGSWVTYTFDRSFAPGLYTIGVQYLNDAMSATEDRNLGLTSIAIAPLNGQADVSLGSASAWLSAAKAREIAMVNDMDAEIRQHRMGNATVTVVDSQGNPLPGATVSVEQASHDFLFGASFAGYQSFGTAAQNAEYERLFSDVFNYATVPFYWSLVEKSQGVYDFARLDSQIGWCTSRGIEVKGHALLWTLDGFTPAWLGSSPSQSAMQGYVQAMLQRYGNDVMAWEIVNEPYNQPGIDMGNPHVWAKSFDPDGLLVVNEYGQFYNGLPGFFSMLDQSMQAGLPVDVVGIQGHAPADTAFPMTQIKNVLDQYAQLGIDVHITELTPPSDGTPTTGAPWFSNWDEATQAEYAELLYRTAFAHPAVTAISWWDFSDHGAWIPSGGLVRADLSPKPAYNVLKQLITEEWNTTEAGQTSTGGEFSFDGYHGDYTVEVVYNGKTYNATMSLDKGKTNAAQVKLNDVTPAVPAPIVTVNPLTTKDTTPLLTGTVQNATSVQVSLNGTTWHTASVQGSAWSVTIYTTVANGTYNVRARATGSTGLQTTDSTTNELRIDTKAPVITLSGGSPVTMERGTAYVEPGFTATDAQEGNLTSQVTVTGSVNTAAEGTYTLTYKVSDSLGNKSSKTRKVTVVYTRTADVIGLIGDVNNDGLIEGWDVTLIYYLNTWGEQKLNDTLRSYNMPIANIRLADVDQDGVVDSWDKTVLEFVLANDLATTNGILASMGKPLAHVGETLNQ
jgi:GH35 family endo-1,4-beta-xylanase